MGNQYRHKIIIDPVHGDIGLSELETKLIDTPTFQRLRKIKQLAFASMVYPNASYSRFAHSIGVLHVTSRVIDAFKRNGHLQDDKDVDKLRIASLLHDVGHYPYSHLMEYIDWDRYISMYLTEKNGKAKGTDQCIDSYPDHAKVARLIVTKRRDVKEILEKHNIEPAEIAALIEGNHPNIPTLLHKSLDVDRIDYLARDSLNTGVPYGSIDINYILNNLNVTEKQEIVLNAKARISAEHLLVSRYFMFNAVYLHKTVFGFEEVVRRIILLLLKKGRIYRSGKEIEEMIAEDSHRFLDFNDGYLDKFIDEYAGGDDDELLTVLCRAIKLRKPPKMIREVVDLRSLQAGGASEEYILFKRCMEKELEEIASKCQIKSEQLIWREAKDVGFEAMYPFVSISKAQDTQEEEIKQLVRVKDSSGKPVNLVEDRKSIIHYLPLTLKVIRLYVVGANEEKVKELQAELQRRF
ncbi:MAG: HD domain-containing protein [Planctomycetota bacterium]|jgi:HD superfamily phosphohydrolase